VANTLKHRCRHRGEGESLQLLVGGPPHVYASGGAVCLTLQVFLPYQRYVRYLKWLTLRCSLFRAGASIRIPWYEVAGAHGDPAFRVDVRVSHGHRRGGWHDDHPYLSSAGHRRGRGTERRSRGRPARACPRRRPKAPSPDQDRHVPSEWAFRIWFAFASSSAAAATLNVGGITDIETAAQAAEALRPLAGPFAFCCSHWDHRHRHDRVPCSPDGRVCRAETFEWKRGLDLKHARGAEFYAIIALATLGGVRSTSRGRSDQGLFWCAVIKRVIAVPIMVVMMLLADDPR